MSETAQHLRVIEALLFAAPEPVPDDVLGAHLPAEADLGALLGTLSADYAERGVNLVRVANGWAFRTAPDLASLLRKESEVQRKLSRAAVETLAIIAYHQPVTRAEIEQIRGVSVSRGTLDILFDAGWVAPRGRRRTPGRPVTWGTTDAFLDHFALASLDDLPGVEELKASGLLEPTPPPLALDGGDADPDADDAEADDDHDPPASLSDYTR